VFPKSAWCKVGRGNDEARGGGCPTVEKRLSDLLSGSDLGATVVMEEGPYTNPRGCL
jgi:hypothetical protein